MIRLIVQGNGEAVNYMSYGYTSMNADRKVGYCFSKSIPRTLWIILPNMSFLAQHLCNCAPNLKVNVTHHPNYINFNEKNIGLMKGKSRLYLVVLAQILSLHDFGLERHFFVLTKGKSALSQLDTRDALSLSSSFIRCRNL